MNNHRKEKQTSLRDMANEVIVNLDKEIHLCKICGEKMYAEQCFAHKEKTGHNEFRPCFEDSNQQLNGGSEK